MSEIHPTAVIDPGAKIADGCSIGPYCVIGSNVTLGEGVRLHSHVVIDGRTTVGARTRIYPFSSIGQPPQDLKYKGEPSELHIGNDNVIREHVTMNPGTEGGGMVTEVGDGCLFMPGSHVAHDCRLGNNVIMANNATLAGHVVLEDYVIMGGLSGAQQFVRVGRNAIIGAMAGAKSDVIPFGMVMGRPGILAGLNLVGLKRAGVDSKEIQALMKAYDHLFGTEGTFAERIDAVDDQYGGRGTIDALVGFLRAETSRPILQPEED
ncbi:acyl-ACP--UDP-N-acetylglucosamine O-acyltransferase [Pelagibius marinus]|uniref:acyl-ACP--UDP-N-acetylglucosamine O-acyltransferase n=1 Tax=Pelagibius marinus TaxID=2762760 RepID=UPI0018729501|nr:acyl-ACP--UDP-N-acetylglucosamine O-acyltransferase [Pelagibius marinus]